MPWYEFEQNNSGGTFEVDDVLCHEVWIEADNKKEACKLFLDWGGYFDGVKADIDCECCGDRWNRPYKEAVFPIDWDRRGTVFYCVEDYVCHCAKEIGSTFKKTYRLFYKNGDVREFSWAEGIFKEKFIPAENERK